jgi:hypothetical protein
MRVSNPMTRPDHRACPSSSPIPAAAQQLGAPAALAPDQCSSLLCDLAQLTDPRQRRGRRHALSAVLAVAAAAVLAGARSLAAIGEWAADAPGPVLAALGTGHDPLYLFLNRCRWPAWAVVALLGDGEASSAIDPQGGSW